MNTHQIDLMPSTPGTQHSFTLLRFGAGLAGPKATIQAALHADELPPILVAQQLRARLAELEAAGQLLGCVQLVPYANPLGLAQQLLGQHQGRFDLADGVNFNRMHADIGATVAASIAPALTQEAAHNVSVIRAALREAAAKLVAKDPAQDLKHKLLQIAIDSDVVLDMHCDSQAAMHLYAHSAHEALAHELGTLLGARAVLLASESGDSPFDEACSRPWAVLQQAFPEHPVPMACFSPTLELRGEADTHHAMAADDADAIIEFLRRRGIVAGTAAALPAARCQPTPLAGSEPIVAPRAGVVVFKREPGENVEAGAVIADLVDAQSGTVEPLCCESAGVLYARISTRWATPGKRIAKVAGTTIVRTGKLLSP
jgi:uncharacterized protein